MNFSDVIDSLNVPSIIKNLQPNERILSILLHARIFSFSVNLKESVVEDMVKDEWKMFIDEHSNLKMREFPT